LEEYPDILTSEASNEHKIALVKSLKGIEKKTAERFVANIPKFMDFVKVAKLEDKITSLPPPVEKDTSNPLYDKSIIITGFRNKELSEELKQLGAKESSAVSKNTFAVLVKTKDEDTGKVEAARKKDIPIYTEEEFKEKFNLSFSIKVDQNSISK
jgi:NAD-dependent DNA ligase